VKRVLSGVALALGAVGMSSASELTTEDAFFSDLPVVASVSRLPQRLADAPTSVTVIDREMIKASGARELSDVFRLVPGFQTHPNNTDSARVTYHGLTDEEFSPRVQVLVDGRSLYSPLFRNGVNWALIPVALDDIERIEVVRGTNAVSYGSNAFLGVINIITLDPALTKGASFSVNHGNQGVRDYSARVGSRLGDRGNFRLTYQQRDDEGLTNRYDWMDSFRSRLFDMRADFALTDRDELQLNIGHTEAIATRGRLRVIRGVPQPPAVLNPGWPIHDFFQSSSHFQAQWRRAYAPGSEFQVRYAYTQDGGSDEYTNSDGATPYRYDTFGDVGRRHEIEAQHSFSPLKDLRLVWGGGWRHDEIRSTTMLAGKGWVEREVVRGFGNAEFRPFSWLTANAGLSSEWDSLAGIRTSPRASLNFHVTPQNTIRVGYSRAYRTASTIDYRGDWYDGSKYQFRGDPDTPAEQLDSWELGYLGDWKTWRMSLDTRLFYEKVKGRLFQYDRNSNNNLVPDLVGAIQDIQMRGLEYHWKWQPFDTTRVTVGQAFIQIQSSYLDGVLANSNSSFGIWPDNRNRNRINNVDLLAEESAPRYSTSILLMQKLPLGFNASVSGFWLDKMRWTQNSSVDKYTRVDGRIAYPFKWGGYGGELAYTVQSLNGTHGEFRNDRADTARLVERRYWFTLRLDL